MTQATPSFAKRDNAPLGLVFVASCATGLALGLLTLLLLLAFAAHEEKRLNGEAHLNGLRMVVANMDNLWDKTALFAEKAAADIQSSGPLLMAEKLKQQHASWPWAYLSLYDQDGNRIPPGADSPFRPSDESARALVHQALIGQSAKDITRHGPYAGLSAAIPVRVGKARALVASVPLDETVLAELKRHSAANMAVLSVDDSGKVRKDGLAAAANTYSVAGGQAAELWSVIRRNPPVFTSRQPGPAEIPDGGHVAAVLMENTLGLPTALLIASAQNPVIYATWPQILTASLGAAVLGALLCLFFLRRYTRRVSESFAGAALCLAERATHCEEKTTGDWPLPLRDALAAIGRVLQEYKKRARAAEAERDAARRLRRENTAHDRESVEEEDYLRLFDNAPIGVFQAENSGAFRRVNQAFALMLGYDNPAMLLAENPSFTSFCLYGDEIRNPLNTLLEQGGGRQILSLRKRDGKTGEYTVVCFPLTSSIGDLLPVAEGFLLDRQLEERLVQAERERERSEKQRTSLALLLAATSLQTGNVLSLPQSPAARGEEKIQPEAKPPQIPEEGNPACPAGTERRKSVRSVQAIMSDIFNIAMAEATGSPPVDLPIELDGFLRHLCRQAAPQLQARGIGLHCEAASDLPSRFSGRAPILRHALQRALLAVSLPAKGGWTYLGVRRDPNHPTSVGPMRLLFSVSWSSFSHEEAADRKEAGLPLALGRENFINIFTADAPDIAECDIPKQRALQLANEQEVIRYLTRQLDGDLLEGAVSSTRRSMQLIVPLTQTGNFSELEAASASAPHEDETAASEEEDADRNDKMSDIGAAPLSDEEAAPLSILVDDVGDFAFDGARVDKDDGLDLLLVDDNMNNRLLFSLYLRDTPHRITEAHNGQEGVEAFKRGRFDVIFMDMEMPLMDGYQATRIIRALEADSGQKNTPIVGMTAYALPEFRHQCILSGCTDFLSKPFGKIALYSVLDAFSQLKKEEAGPE